MAATTLYRFRLELSDIDNNRYDTLDFRIAMHPSETMAYLITRVIAYALNAGPDVAFTPGGLADTDGPAISQPDPNGGTKLWIEIGNPSARKAHRASKASRLMKIYTYKDPEALLRELRSENVHRAEEIEIFALTNEFLKRVEALIERDNKWSVIHSDGALTITSGERSESGELTPRNIRDT